MRRRILLPCLVALLVPAALPATASAHHADVTASVDCGGLVSYTATSWVSSPPQRTNNSVSISVGGAVVNSGSFTSANGFSISGTHQLPSPLPASTTVTVTYGAFGPAGEYGSAGSASSGAVAIAPCPAQPGGSIADVDCAQGGAVVSLSNTGGLDATIRITRDGGVVEDVVVAGGGSASRLVAIAEDTTSTVTLSSGGATLASRSLSANCALAPPIPAASIADLDCAQGGALVTYANTGEEGVTFTTTLDGAAVGSDTVAGGATATRLVPVAENATSLIVVSAPGLADVSRSLARDCVPPAQPAATIGAVSCGDGGAHVTVTNAGGEATTFTITANATVVDTLAVLPASSAVKFVPVPEDGTVTVLVTAPGMVDVTGNVSRDCTPNAPTVPPTTPPPGDPGSAGGAPPEGSGPTAVGDAISTPGSAELSLGGLETILDNAEPSGTALLVDEGERATLTPMAERAVVVGNGTDGELPFTGVEGVPAVVLGGLLALLLGCYLSLPARRRRLAGAGATTAAG